MGRFNRESVLDTSNNSRIYASEYGYDRNNNVNKIGVIAGNTGVSMTYTYGTDNLPTAYTAGEKVGTFTGYYYTATFSAQIASPIIYGFIRMFAGTYMSLFYYSPIMFLAAIIMIMFVKHGEAEIPDEVLKEAAQND